MMFNYIPGTLKLVEIEEVDIRSRKNLEIVESLCPDLKSIRFNHSESEDGAEQDLISIEEIQSIFSSDSKCWSKVIKEFNSITQGEKVYQDYIYIFFFCIFRFKV